VRRNDFNLGLRLELIFEISEDLCLDNLQHLNLVLGGGAAGVGLQSPPGPRSRTARHPPRGCSASPVNNAISARGELR
jgi:hypothetical protein